MTTLFDIVERINLESKEIDSMFRNKSRHMMNFYAKEGLNKLNMTFALNIHGLTVQIPSSCKVQKPDGYKAFVRASILDCDGKLIEIERNNKVPSEVFQYLVDCDGTIMSDENGELNNGEQCKTCTPSNYVCPDCGDTDCNCHFEFNQMYSKETHQQLYDFEKYKNSYVRVKDDSDYFIFSSDLEDSVVFIEYLSNQTKGVEECQIKVDDSISVALEYYIKFRLLEGGQETLQQSEIFKRKFKAEADNQKVKQNALTLNDLYKVFFK